MANENFLKGQDYEPKKQDRGILNIDGVDAWVIRTANRPHLTNDEIEIPYINNTRYVKGKSTGNTMDITLQDPISPAASKQVYEWLLLHHDSATGIDGYKSEYAKDISLKIISGLGSTVEEGTLHKTGATDVDFGSLDMTSADPIEITCTLRYDGAELIGVAE